LVTAVPVLFSTFFLILPRRHGIGTFSRALIALFSHYVSCPVGGWGRVVKEASDTRRLSRARETPRRSISSFGDRLTEAAMY